jgi:two-component system NtrC family sensor kinase
MRLAHKLTLALSLGVLTVMAGYAYLQVRHEVVLFDADLQRVLRPGRAFRAVIEQVWREEGMVRAEDLVDRANRAISEVVLRWVWLDLPRGDAGSPAVSAEQLAALRRGEEVRIVRNDERGEPVRIGYLPMQISDPRPAAIELIQPLSPELTFQRVSHREMLLATLAMAGVCGLIAMALGSWFVSRPITRLRDLAQRVGAGDFSPRLHLKQRDEIGQLAEEIDAMCDRLAESQERLRQETEGRIQAIEQLRHVDRLATVGQLASGVAHELGTPLSVVGMRAQLIAGASQASEAIGQNARTIVEQADRMSEIIRQLLDFSRRRGAKLATADARQLVEHTLDMLSSMAERAKVQFVSDTGTSPIFIRADQNQLTQALANVVLNGIQAMPHGGRLTVRLECRTARRPDTPEAPAASVLCVIIEDQGSGVAPEYLQRIFEPFFTTKGVGEGTGLGLAVAHGIVTDHGGWIEVESEVGKGTCFRIFLPPTAEPTAQAAGGEI